MLEEENPLYGKSEAGALAGGAGAMRVQCGGEGQPKCSTQATTRNTGVVAHEGARSQQCLVACSRTEAVCAGVWWRGGTSVLALLLCSAPFVTG